MASKTPHTAQPPSPERLVAEYLRTHPDFLERHPDLAAGLTLPARWEGGDSVVDLQTVMIDRLRQDLTAARDAGEDLVETARANLTVQSMTHRAVLAVLDTDDMEQLARAVADDLPAILDIDVAVLAFETGTQALPEMSAPSLQRLDPGLVDYLMRGAERAVTLADDRPGDAALFGAGAGLVVSQALARLNPGAKRPVGMLGLGSRHAGFFHPGQATEMLNFLARVVEARARHFVA